MPDDDEKPPRRTVCRRCDYAITWAEQRRQYGRAIRQRVDVGSRQAAHAAMPEVHHYGLWQPPGPSAK